MPANQYGPLKLSPLDLTLNPTVPLDHRLTRHLGAFELNVVMMETSEALYGDVWYNIDLFERADVEKLSAIFMHTLENVFFRPNARFSELVRESLIV